ncbi:MAG: LPP20 family lipoprotein [Candidatus Paceibacterota bacterium]
MNLEERDHNYIYRITCPYPSSHSLLVVVVFLFLATCSSQKSLSPNKSETSNRNQPSWVKSEVQPKYNSPDYISAVGISEVTDNKAKARKEADQNAFSNISRQIFAEVTSEITVRQSSVKKNNVETILEQTIANSNVQSSVSITGLKIVDRYYDTNDNVYYSLGILDKKKATENYRSKLTQIKNTYDDYISSYKRNKDKGQLFQSILNLKEAMHEAVNYQKILPTLDLLNPEKVKAINWNHPSYSKVLNYLSNTLTNLKFEITQGQKQDYIVGLPLADPLRTLLILEHGTSQRIPITNALIIFNFQEGEGELNEKTKTNSSGIASTRVNDITKAPSEKVVVQARLDLSSLEDTTKYANEWNKRLRTATQNVLFHFLPKKASSGINILIDIFTTSSCSTSNKELPNEIFSSTLSKVGFNTKTIAKNDISDSSDDHDIIISGSISCTPKSEVQDMTIYNGQINVSASIIQQDSDEVRITEFSQQEIRGFGLNEKQAIKKAIINASEKGANYITTQLLDQY